MWVCAHKQRCPRRPEEALGFPGAELTGSYEPPDVGARTQTMVLCKSREFSYPLSHPTSPFFPSFPVLPGNLR